MFRGLGYPLRHTTRPFAGLPRTVFHPCPASTAVSEISDHPRMRGPSPTVVVEAPALSLCGHAALPRRPSTTGRCPLSAAHHSVSSTRPASLSPRSRLRPLALLVPGRATSRLTSREAPATARSPQPFDESSDSPSAFPSTILGGRVDVSHQLLVRVWYESATVPAKVASGWPVWQRTSRPNPTTPLAPRNPQRAYPRPASPTVP